MLSKLKINNLIELFFSFQKQNHKVRSINDNTRWKSSDSIPFLDQSEWIEILLDKTTIMNFESKISLVEEIEENFWNSEESSIEDRWNMFLL